MVENGIKVELKAIDEHIKLAEELKKRGEVTAANSIFLDCAILLGKLVGRIHKESKYPALTQSIDMSIRRCL